MLHYFRNRKTLGYFMGAVLLGIVIFSFIILYIPDFMSRAGANVPGGAEVAIVEGRAITAKEYLESYRRLERMYRAQMGERYSPQMLQQLGIRESALSSLVQELSLTVEAEREGLRVTDAELREAILTDPSFQTNGKFIGRSAYLQILVTNGLSAAQFEESLRSRILSQKLHALVTDGVMVDPRDVELEYRRRNEKAKLEYVVVARAGFEKDLQVTDDEVAQYFEKNKDRYRLPVQRKIRFFTLGPEQFMQGVKVTDREIQRNYNANINLYQMPDQVRASHILFKTTDKNVEEVRKKAEAVLAEARAPGADFAALAKKYSEDTSKEQGGDLGFFGQGELPELERTAFAMSEGEVSDLVKSTLGYHIGKVTERQPGLTRPLETVKDQISGLLRTERAGQLMEQAVQDASNRLARTENLEALAQQYNITTQETPFFGRNETLTVLGNSPEIKRVAFETKLGDVAPVVALARGYAFFRVLEEKPSRTPTLDEVKDKVKADALKEKAMALARARAEELRAKLERAGSNLAAAAKAAGAELKTQDSFLRTSQIAELGRSAAVEREAFALETGVLSPPLAGDQGYVLIRVLERSGYSPESFASEKETFTERLLDERRARVWSAFVQDLDKRLDIKVNRDAMLKLFS